MEDETENSTKLIGLSAYERFLIRSQSDIVALLRSLLKDAVQMAAYPDSGTQSAMTSIVYLDPEKDMLVLERCRNDVVNQRILESREVFFDIKQNSITIQFLLTGIKPARFKGNPVFLASIPEEMLRLQRREFYRVSITPTGEEQPTCTLIRSNNSRYEAEVSDISLGGIGLVDRTQSLPVRQLEVFKESRINLPGFGLLVADLEIRNVFETLDNKGEKITRIGCAFINLPNDMSTLLQRYLHKMQIANRGD